MTIFCFIQPSLNSSARELWLDGIVGVVHGNYIFIEARRFGSIGLFLLIEQVFGQVAQISQYLFFRAIQFQSNCLSQQHNVIRYVVNILAES
jgi:hypothetical protein